jgi:hypothetical protein
MANSTEHDAFIPTSLQDAVEGIDPSVRASEVHSFDYFDTIARNDAHKNMTGEKFWESYDLAVAEAGLPPRGGYKNRVESDILIDDSGLVASRERFVEGMSILAADMRVGYVEFK